MGARTFAIGDIHGDVEHLEALLGKLPKLSADDTLLFVGDYVDRGPRSADVVARVRALEASPPCKVVALMGNHEEAWLRVIDDGWPEFVIPVGNGCLATYRSFVGGAVPEDEELPKKEELLMLTTGEFLPDDVVAWFRKLRYWYEDDHAIYVHAGITDEDGLWMHPSEEPRPSKLLWTRSERFFRDYAGKRVVFGHTATNYLPPELSTHTPADPDDMWVSDSLIALDTGCGKGGFLTCVELPSLTVYESR